MEVWKAIKDYEGLYEISNLGRVKSLKRNKLLKQQIGTWKYSIIKLYKEGNCRNFKIHRLVAISFINNIYNKEQINHIDGNKQNNIVFNLEWCSRLENMQHAHNTGLIGTKKRIKVYNDFGFSKVYESVMCACKELNLIKSCLCRVAKGERNTHKQYKARYI